MKTYTAWACALLLSLAQGCQKSGQPPARAQDAAPVAAPTPAPAPALAKSATGARVIQMKVTEDGYVPAKLEVKKGEPLELRVTRTTNETCATELIIEGTTINAPLPYNEEVTIRWTPEKTGQVKYGCHMDMMISGVLMVE
jgi:plastocyanin domain-containing protein